MTGAEDSGLLKLCFLTCIWIHFVIRYAGKYQTETNKKQLRSRGIDTANTLQTGDLEKLWMLLIRK